MPREVTELTVEDRASNFSSGTGALILDEGVVFGSFVFSESVFGI